MTAFPVIDWRLPLKDEEQARKLDEKRAALSYKPKRGFLLEKRK